MANKKKTGPKVPRKGQERVIALQCRPTVKRLIDKEAKKARLKPNDWLEFAMWRLMGLDTPEQIQVASLKVCFKEVMEATFPNEKGILRDLPYNGYEVLLRLMQEGIDASEMAKVLMASGVRAKHAELACSVVDQLAIGAGSLVYVVD